MLITLLACCRIAYSLPESFSFLHFARQFGWQFEWHRSSHDRDLATEITDTKLNFIFFLWWFKLQSNRVHQKYGNSDSCGSYENSFPSFSYSRVTFQIHLNKPAVQHKCNKSHILNWFITRWLLLSKAANDDGLALGLITASQSPKYKKSRVEKYKVSAEKQKQRRKQHSFHVSFTSFSLKIPLCIDKRSLNSGKEIQNSPIYSLQNILAAEKIKI